MAEPLVYDGATEPPLCYTRQVRSLLEAEGFLEPSPADAGDGFPLIAPKLHLVYWIVVEGRTVQSYGRTIWARIEYLGRSCKLYGLGDVVTRAAMRKMGCGSRIVGAATAHIRGDRDADAAVLLTEPKLEAFYARHGWEHARVGSIDKRMQSAFHFAHGLLPGDSTSAYLRVRAPSEPGFYLLQPDLVEELVAWASSSTTIPKYPVEVR